MKIIKCKNQIGQVVYLNAEDIVKFVSVESGKTEIYSVHEPDVNFSIDIECEILIKLVHGDDVEIIDEENGNGTAYFTS